MCAINQDRRIRGAESWEGNCNDINIGWSKEAALSR